MRNNCYIGCLFIFFFHAAVAQDPAGKMLQTIKCSADTTEKYALYLPTHYVSEKNYPLIIYLDPGARGHFPVSKYQALAEKHGIIMVGSYGSRNFDGFSSEKAFVAIYNDIVKNYPVDPTMVWISGFSGGSRAAAALSMGYPAITGVIGCGAGFVETDDESLKKLRSYVALSGDRDMNLGELIENSEYLDEIEVNNMLLQFEGGHEWPPVIYMDLAFLWLTGRTAGIDADILRGIRAKADSGLLYGSWAQLKQLEKIPAWKDSAAALANQLHEKTNFTDDQRRVEMVMEEERKAVNDFSIAFSKLLGGESIQKEEWLLKAKRTQLLQKDKDRYKQLSGQRLFNQAVATCQEYFFELMRHTVYAKALKTADIFLCFDPDNSQGYYMMARAEAGLGNKNRAEKNLREAGKRGFKWNSRIETDILLMKMFKTEELRRMLGTK